MARIYGAWESRAVCPCGYHEEAPFGKLFHIHREVCPNCARKVGRRGGGEFTIQTMRNVWTPVWWQPWTWLRNEWETKSG